MKAQINLQHLKYFCDAVMYGSISESAKTNYVTQSTVSQAVAKLEHSIGTPLLVHSRQKFQVTEEGRIVFEEARHIFEAVQNIQEKINTHKETVTGSLKFVSTNSLGMSFIAPSYQKMGEKYPGVDISFQLGNLQLIRSSLKKGDAEFGIVVFDDTFLEFNKRIVKKGKLKLYQSVHSKFTLFDSGILVDSKSGMHVDSLEAFYPFKIQAALAGWEVVARFTEMNIGIGFIPDYILENNRYPSLMEYPMELPPFEYEICAIYNKGVKLSKAANAFLEQVI